MKIMKVRDALQEMDRINDEIRTKSFVEAKAFSVGVISFRPREATDSKQITHEDRDVVCHVLRGHGRLRLADRTIDLEPGMLCHIPKGTRHDFAADGVEELVLIYSLITTG